MTSKTNVTMCVVWNTAKTLLCNIYRLCL